MPTVTWCYRWLRGHHNSNASPHSTELSLEALATGRVTVPSCLFAPREDHGHSSRREDANRALSPGSQGRNGIGTRSPPCLARSPVRRRRDSGGTWVRPGPPTSECGGRAPDSGRVQAPRGRGPPAAVTSGATCCGRLCRIPWGPASPRFLTFVICKVYCFPHTWHVKPALKIIVLALPRG